MLVRSRRWCRFDDPFVRQPEVDWLLFAAVAFGLPDCACICMLLLAVLYAHCSNNVTVT